MNILLVIASLLTVGAEANSGTWSRLVIPDTKCGDGSPYAVYVRAGLRDKVLLHFQGGGACWDFVTCRLIPNFTPHREKPPAADSTGILSTDPADSPLSAYSAVHFPYCTGDAFAGRHTAHYAFGTTMNHWGAINVERALAVLARTRVLRLEKSREIVVYGFSAGAIGAIFSVGAVEKYLHPEQRRVAILDAPGLHFGHAFWWKFTRAQIADFATAFANLDIELDPNNGNLARHAPALCRRYSRWTVGVLQSSRDIVMSVIFSQMTPLAHERLVYGPNGIFETLIDPFDNCSSWTPQTTRHTFLTDHTGGQYRAGTTTALEFVSDLIDGHGGLSYR